MNYYGATGARHSDTLQVLEHSGKCTIQLNKLNIVFGRKGSTSLLGFFLTFLLYSAGDFCLVFFFFFILSFKINLVIIKFASC